ncbi:SDR family NAD(P)-dependent oxidoreductase [Rhodococcus wratislaviensis]|uniref:SDR family NAD(P)-dependent oxidoreductase n=1 Tax=Rhodococcus wratislaviensis TaxID=44752 RepID=UPI003653AABE
MKVWFITGTSRGFGREWAEAALNRGDAVVATARDASSLEPLVADYGDRVLTLPLDVTDRSAAFEAVRRGHERFGRLDVIVNNAGYPQQGMVEELSEADVRDQIETNLFGAIWVTQASLPYLRAQRSGHILQVSSVGGVTAWPNIGMYNASKWALEGISQALADEVAAFGIRVTLLEPGGFATDPDRVSIRLPTPIPDYDVVRESPAFGQRRLPRTGSPTAAATAVLELVDLEEPPLRIFLGEDPLRLVEDDYKLRLALWRQWDWLSREAGGAR